MHRLVALAIVSALGASTALADTPKKRATPVYDGREKEHDGALRTAGRVILYPVYAVVNYGIRWPLSKIVTWLENSHGVRGFVHVWFLGPATDTMSIFPIAFYDFGFQSSIGVRMLWENGFATKGSKFSLKLGYGGTNFYRGDASTRIALPENLRLWADVGIRHRADQLYYGPGPRAPEVAEARYAETRGAAMLAFGTNKVRAFIGSSAVAATESTFNGHESIDQQVELGNIDRLPTGYNQLLITRREGVRLAFDSRSHTAGEVESGGRFDATIERVHTTNFTSWTHVDIRAGGALQLDSVGEHMLDLRARIELLESDHLEEIPFMELATIGGTRDLRGFGYGRTRGYSAAAVSLDYQWPLAAWLDATLYTSVGNSFGENFSGFYLGELRGSVGLGLGLAGLSEDRQIELWSALGFEPLGQGLDISNFRLVLGYAYDY